MPKLEVEEEEDEKDEKGEDDPLESEEEDDGTDTQYYEAECITNQKGVRKGLQYLVKFKPGPNGEEYPKHWCAAKHVTEALVEKFYETHTKSGKRRKRMT